GFSGPIALSALAFADYLGHFCKACAQEQPHVLFGAGEFTLAFGKPQMFACGLVLVFTVLNVLGVQRSASVQNVLTSAKVILLVTFVIGALAVGKGSWSHLSMPAIRTAHTSIPEQFAISLFWIYLAYSGWNAATYVAEELRQPSFTLPRALTIGTLLVTALYVSLNFIFIYAEPLEDMKGEMAVGAVAAARLFGPGIAGTFSALVALALLSAVNAMVTIGPRVYYAMAKNGAFLSSAAWVHPKWHTPVFAIVAQAICAMFMTMTPFPQLVVYIGFLLNFFAVMSVASLLLFRRRPGWQKLKAVSFCYPLIPVLFILVGAWMTIYGIVLKPFVSMATLATVLAGALVFHFRIRARQRVAEASPTVETY
ncbi:MAG TPA: amino acid permease, partial [Bryobacteraceae bacterium]|nr:amino acid permease [Bryobacteraceae bacterium]